MNDFDVQEDDVNVVGKGIFWLEIVMDDPLLWDRDVYLSESRKFTRSGLIYCI